MNRIVLLMLAALASGAAGYPTFDPKWRECGKAEECVAIHDSCLVWTCVNRKHVKQAEDFFNEVAPNVRCAQPKQSPPPAPKCVKKTCSC